MKHPAVFSKFLLALCALVVFTAGAYVQEPLASPPTVESEAGDSVLETFEEREYIVVEMPQLLRQRLENISGAKNSNSSAETPEGLEENAEETDGGAIARPRVNKVVGYRVQVFADNNPRTAKGEARQRERTIGGSFPQLGTYVTYASPYWRLRVGDFRSQYEAEKAATEIRKSFPRYAKEVRVVRDRVNVR